jgi:hypothetical protein
MNLFVGVVIDHFKQMKEELCGYSLLNDEQREWVDIQRFMQRKKLKLRVDIPKNKYRAFCYYISNHPNFEKFILVCIFLNIVVMGLHHEGIDSGMTLLISTANNVFLGIYHAECLIKIIATGLFYFKDSWNK